MIDVIGVRFRKAGKIYYFDPLEFVIPKDSAVIVETARGTEYGSVAIARKSIKEQELSAPLKPIIRPATFQDQERYQENQRLALEAAVICEKKIADNHLEMYLVDTEYTFDRNKLIFHFTAEGRIDFRNLVKDLAAIFKTRIELRQIGVRDEAKALGGIGCCGKPLCCNTWLGDFQPVSIKMAKDQDLSLNPTKISGICGRLFCCLKYEHPTYEALLQDMPEPGSIVKTPEGLGKVLSKNTLSQEATVLLESKERDGAPQVRKFSGPTLEVIQKPRHQSAYHDRELKMLED